MKDQSPSRPARNDLIALAVLTVAVIVYIAPVFSPVDSQRNQDAFKSHDWLQIATYDLLFRKAILEEHAFPLRTYFLGGGYPLIGNPQDDSLSPFVWTSVVMGERLGMKVNLLMLHLLGAWGAYAFCRLRRKATPAGAALAGCLLVFSGWAAGRMEYGFYVKFLFLLSPWAFLFIETIPERRAAIVGLAVSIALILSQLGLGFEVIMLFLGLAALLGDVGETISERRPSASRLFGLAAAMLLAALLMAGRLVPMVEILHQNPREVSTYSSYSELTLGGTPQFYSNLKDLASALIFYRDTMNWPVGIGPLGLVLAAVGIAASGIRRVWIELATLLIAAWLCLGPFAGVDLFKLLWSVPYFNSMHMPFQLFNFFLLWPLVVLAGCSVPSPASAAWARGLAAPATAAAAVAAAWIGYLHGPIYDRFFIEPVQTLPVGKEFYQVSGDSEMGRGSPRSLRSHQYYNLLRNVGTIDWDGDVLLPEHARPRYVIDLNDRVTSNPEYRGEAYVEPGPAGIIEKLVLRSNSISVSGRLDGPALVVVNQNMDRWWRLRPAQGARLGSGPLVSAEVDRPGPFALEFVYRPWPTLIGLSVSVVSWASLIVWFILWTRRSKEPCESTSRVADYRNG